MAETKTVRPIAMGVGAIRIADVGDGVPGTDFTTLPLPTKSSVAFNFADPVLSSWASIRRIAR